MTKEDFYKTESVDISVNGNEKLELQTLLEK